MLDSVWLQFKGLICAVAGIKIVLLPGKEVININRNVSIVIALLVVVVIAGYLIWLRSKVSSSVVPQVQQQAVVSPKVEPTATASVSAAPLVKEATGGAAKPKAATSGAIRR